MTVLAKLLAVGTGLATVTFSLQGCGGSSPKPSPSPSPSPTPHPSPSPTPTPTPPPTTSTTTTTGTPKPRTPGGEPQAVADALNKLYYAFDKDDDTSDMGVTINLPSDNKNFYGNVFCSEYDNPHGKTGCSDGRCDCRFSAALYNHQMMITEGDTVMDVLKRRVFIAFNQTMVEEKFSRCYYVWDGASNNKLNVGCGIGADSNLCSANNSAYGNICKSGKVCTANDQQSKDGMCKQYGGLHDMPAQHSGTYQCSFPGPALDFHGQDDWQPDVETKKDLRSMIKFRLDHQEGFDGKELKSGMWNEVVMDLRLMMPAIWEDPALVVPAFLYWKDDAVAKMNAKAMRDNFCQVNQLDKKIPVLALDWRAVVTKKEPVFVVLPEDNDEDIVV